ncbi:hypothetical protein STEG23_001826 [Scotinomys teguina]
MMLRTPVQTGESGALRRISRDKHLIARPQRCVYSTVLKFSVKKEKVKRTALCRQLQELPERCHLIQKIPECSHHTCERIPTLRTRSVT